jgi:hypothetical protein
MPLSRGDESNGDNGKDNPEERIQEVIDAVEAAFSEEAIEKSEEPEASEASEEPGESEKSE